LGNKSANQSGRDFVSESSGALTEGTFVQFYPTLIDLAKKRGTLAPGYLKEETASETEGSAKKAN